MVTLTNLPPTLDRPGLKTAIMDMAGWADLTGEEFEALDPFVDDLVKAIFHSRGEPKTIMTPLAMSLACEGIEAVAFGLHERSGERG